MTLFGKPVIITGTSQDQAEVELEIMEEAERMAKQNPIQINGDGTWGSVRADMVLHFTEAPVDLKYIKFHD